LAGKQYAFVYFFPSSPLSGSHVFVWCVFRFVVVLVQLFLSSSLDWWVSLAAPCPQRHPKAKPQCQNGRFQPPTAVHTQRVWANMTVSEKSSM
jgi:hypothetical protein